MSANYWIGKAAAVAQVTTVQITAYDAATTYKITCGGVTVQALASGNANDTATALATAWNLSVHPYLAAVTALAITDTITFTADVAGVPFVLTSAKSGGTGTIGAATTATASAGPNDWSTAANWSAGTVPVNGDDVQIPDGTSPIYFGLSQSAVALASLWLGVGTSVGLPLTGFLTTNGVWDQTVTEYREDWLKIAASTVRIYQSTGTIDDGGSTFASSGLVKLDLQTTATVVESYNSPTTDDNKPGVRLKGVNVANVVNIYGGAVAIADEEISDVSTFATVSMLGTGQVILGAGVTLDVLDLQNGTALLRCAPTTVREESGATLRIRASSGTITTLEHRGTLDMAGSDVGVTHLKG